MQISICSLAGSQPHILEIEGGTSVLELLSKLQSHGLVPASTSLRLAKDDEIVSPNSSLSLASLGVEEGSIFTLVTEKFYLLLEVVGGGVKIWNSISGDYMHTLAHRGLDEATFSTDGSLVLTKSYSEGTCKIWNCTSGDCMHTLAHPDLTDAIFSIDGSLVLTRSRREGTCKIWNCTSGDCMHTFGSVGTSAGVYDLCKLLRVTCVLGKADIRSSYPEDVNLVMLEKCLQGSDSGACLEHQAQLQMTILESRLSESLKSLRNESESECCHTSNDASSSGGTLSGPISAISVAGSEPTCYPSGTSFRTGFGEKVIEDIKEKDVLVSADGTLVEVKSITRHASTDRPMVLLETESFMIALTMNHRVVVPRGGSLQTIPAGHLRVGDSVLFADKEQELKTAQPFFGDIDVFEMVLEPDKPIETFYVAYDGHEGILTKGKRACPRNRGYIRK